MIKKYTTSMGVHGKNKAVSRMSLLGTSAAFFLCGSISVAFAQDGQVQNTESELLAQPVITGPSSTDAEGQLFSNQNTVEQQTQEAQPQFVPEPSIAADGTVNPPQPPAGADIDFENLENFQFEAITQEELATLTPVERQKLIEAQAKQLAYDAALNGLFPLKPDQIRNVLQRYDETTEAAQTPIKEAPTPEITIENVSLDPSAVPPLIKVAPGFVTTVSILDMTGEPWPIQDISWGGDFDILQPEEGSNVIRITPLGRYKYGNISMRLIDLKTPIVFRIQAFEDVVQYRFDARIPKRGPGAAIPLIEQQVVSAVAGEDFNLMQILDGVPPSDATILNVNGTDGRTTAYRVSGRVYLRTPLTLLSPAWSQSVSSADGVKVYALNNAPVVLLSDAGRVFRASLSERVASQ